MLSNRLRSIIPIFGGGTGYVETLNAILDFVETHLATTDELVGWHQSFTNVSSRDSILRRGRSIQQAGFHEHTTEHWTLGDAGSEYVQNQDTETLLRIMCNRNVGHRSLPYALSAGPMTNEDIRDQKTTLESV